MQERAESNRKRIDLELMRIFAIFWVIFNHTGNDGFLLFRQRPVGSIQYFVYMFLSVFCLFPVPLFFAVSGALMLEKEESLQKIMKRAGRFAAVIVFANLVYYICELGIHGVNEFDLKYYLMSLYSKPISTHLWYLYAYIAYLLVLPFLRAMAKSLEKKWYRYLIALWILMNSIVPVLEYLIGKGALHYNSSSFDISWLFARTVFYPLVGYYLDKEIHVEKLKKWLFLLVTIDFLGIWASVEMNHYKNCVTGEYNGETFFASFLAVNCIAVFILIKYICKKVTIPEKFQNVIISLGSCTFGIYLLHVLLLRNHYMNRLLEWLKHIGMNAMLAVLLECLGVMLVSYVIIWIIKRIPLVGKLL